MVDVTGLQAPPGGGVVGGGVVGGGVVGGGVVGGGVVGGGVVGGGVVSPYVTRTATQSRKKSREVLLATLVMRTRSVVLFSSPVVQVRPQLSLALPSVRLAM